MEDSTNSQEIDTIQTSNTDCSIIEQSSTTTNSEAKNDATETKKTNNNDDQSSEETVSHYFNRFIKWTNVGISDDILATAMSLFNKLDDTQCDPLAWHNCLYVNTYFSIFTYNSYLYIFPPYDIPTFIDVSQDKNMETNLKKQIPQQSLLTTQKPKTRIINLHNSSRLRGVQSEYEKKPTLNKDKTSKHQPMKVRSTSITNHGWRECIHEWIEE
jgi:hypothetical protein